MSAWWLDPQYDARGPMFFADRRGERRRPIRTAPPDSPAGTNRQPPHGRVYVYVGPRKVARC
jgi:hypothetical protein